MEQGSFQHENVGVPRSTKAGASQLKGSKATLPLTALLWVLLGSGEHVLYGMFGSMETEFEMQRTIKRAELTAF